MTDQLRRFGAAPFVLLGLVLAILGVLALTQVVDNFWPFDVTRLDLVRATALDRVDAPSILEAGNNEILLAFFASIVILGTGVALPFAYFLNRRFGNGMESTQFFVVVRQGIWVGVWLAFCVWLRMNRSFGIAVATLVAVVLVMFEILLQVRTRASGLDS